MRTEKEYADLAEWAERLDPTQVKGGTVRRGAAAAAYGRQLLEDAAGGSEKLRRVMGRPSIDPQAGPGEHARVRQVRLPAAANQLLDAVAAAQGRKPSAVLRDAVDEYLAAHYAS